MLRFYANTVAFYIRDLNIHSKIGREVWRTPGATILTQQNAVYIS